MNINFTKTRIAVGTLLLCGALGVVFTAMGDASSTTTARAATRVSTEEELARVRERIVSLRSKLASMDTIAPQIAAEVEALEQDIKRLQEELTNAQFERDAVLAEVVYGQDAKAELASSIHATEAVRDLRLKSLANIKAKTSANADIADTVLTKLKNEYEQTEATYQNNVSELARLNGLISKANKKLDKIDANVTDAQDKLKSARTRISNAETKQRELKQKKEQLQREIDKLEHREQVLRTEVMSLESQAGVQHKEPGRDIEIICPEPWKLDPRDGLKKLNF